MSGGILSFSAWNGWHRERGDNTFSEEYKFWEQIEGRRQAINSSKQQSSAKAKTSKYNRSTKKWKKLLEFRKKAIDKLEA